MDNFRNILFVTRPNDDPAEGLKQALMLAKNSHAALKVVVAASQLPDKLTSYNQAYVDGLKEKIEEQVGAALNATGLAADGIEIAREVLPVNKFAVDIIQYAIRHGHDLLVKHAEGEHDTKGFKATDMALLRKCPCPVWLWRPQRHTPENLRIAAAIDAQSPEQEAQDLARSVLRVANQLSQGSSNNLEIISCWEYEFEQYLRTNSWVKVPEEEINEAVAEVEKNHAETLTEIMDAADVSVRPNRARGEPADILPKFVHDNKIDVLVMGTVGRSGIPGFIIGNTAENVLQEVSCSLLALKPAGFKSPVDAYEK